MLSAYAAGGLPADHSPGNETFRMRWGGVLDRSSIRVEERLLAVEAIFHTSRTAREG